VRDGVEGIIVRPEDVEAIAAALEHLLAIRSGWNAWQCGPATGRLKFTWDHFRTVVGRYESRMQKVSVLPVAGFGPPDGTKECDVHRAPLQIA